MLDGLSWFGRFKFCYVRYDKSKVLQTLVQSLGSLLLVTFTMVIIGVGVFFLFFYVGCTSIVKLASQSSTCI